MRRFVTVMAVCAFSWAVEGRAEEPGAEARAALADIKSTLGFVPGFMAAFPEEGLPGAWDEFKSVQLNPHSAIPPKYKELIGLGVAAQVPCEYCVYFHT
jgi:alkylhydroperoxidase/carboxymuconolactone decarboxylase family protein YurZ